jgi:hypothetical protein
MRAFGSAHDSSGFRSPGMSSVSTLNALSACSSLSCSLGSVQWTLGRGVAIVEVLLRPHQIGLCQPRSEVGVDVAQLSESKCMHMIPRRERLDGAKARMLETTGKNHMAIKPRPPRRDLGKRHAHLKGDPGLLGQNSHWANRSNGGDHTPEERANCGWLATKVMGEREPSAGMRLIAVGEGPPALPASPQGCAGRSVGHVISSLFT